MESNEKNNNINNMNIKQLSNLTKKRKFVPNIPLNRRVTVKVEPIPLNENPKFPLNKNDSNIPTLERKNKPKRKHIPNLKILATKGLFSEGFQRDLKIDDKTHSTINSSKIKSTKTTSTIDDREIEPQPSSAIALIDEPLVENELAKLIKQFGEYFPVALPLTTKLDSIIHENDSKEQDFKPIVDTCDFKTNNNYLYSAFLKYFTENGDYDCNNSLSDEFILFQMPASYSSTFGHNKKHIDDNENLEFDSENEFDLYGDDIENPNFLIENDVQTVGNLIITQSGKVKLIMGNETYDVNDTMNNCFLQELYLAEFNSSKDDDEDPIFAKIGRISEKFVCSWELKDSDIEKEDY